MVDLKELDGSKSVKDNIYTLDNNVKAVKDNLKDYASAESVEGIKESYVAKEKLKDMEIPLTEQPSINNLESGDKISILFSKIKKWFTGLKDGSFVVSKANNVCTTHGNESNLCDNYNSDIGWTALNYRGALKPISSYIFFNGQKSELFKISKDHFHGSSENVITKLDTTCRYTANPKGGFYSNNHGDIIGAIKITLPCIWSNSMLKFKVSIFEYYNQKISDFMISGYTSINSNKWIRPDVGTLIKKIGNSPKVRFGHDGEKCCVYIGELSSKWSHLGVHITDLEEHNALLIGDEWNISIVDKFQNVTETLGDNLVIASSAKKLEPAAEDISTTLQNGWGIKYGYNVLICKCGSIVNVVGLIANGVTEDDTTIINVPNKYRPRGNRYVRISVSDGKQVGLVICANGDVVTSKGWYQANYNIFNFQYII